MGKFRVSVVIPVYNAARFVAEAVQSALAQPETAEVILIEDGSPDDSLAVCQALAEKYDKVRLLRHPDGKNHGAGASRNLGMRNAQYDYIAFLDADDYYLPGRFKVAKEIFEADPECDGVYEAIGKVYDDEEARERWIESSMAVRRMTTVERIIPPDELFKVLVLGGAGYFSIDGLVIKKPILTKTGFMNIELKLHQDSDFIYRLAAVSKLLPGQLKKPVTIRRIHLNNRISTKRSPKKVYEDRMKMWKATYQWLHQSKLRDKEHIVLSQMVKYCAKNKPLPLSWMIKFPKEFQYLIRLSLLPFDYPMVVITSCYWKKILSIKIWPVVKRNIRKLINT